MKNILNVSSQVDDDDCDSEFGGTDDVSVTVESTYQPHTKNVYSAVVFGAQVYSCSLDGELRVWGFEKKDLLYHIRVEGGGVRDLIKWDERTFLANGYRGIHIFKVLEKHPYCQNTYTIYNDIGSGFEFSKFLRLDDDRFLSTTIRGESDILVVSYSQKKVLKCHRMGSSLLKWYTQIRKSKIYPNCIYMNLGTANDELHGIVCLYDYEKGEVFSKFTKGIELIVFSMEIFYKSSQKKEYMVLGGSQKSVLVFDVSVLPHGELVKKISGDNWIYSLLNICDTYLTIGLDSGHIEVHDFFRMIEDEKEKEEEEEKKKKKKRKKFKALEKRDWVISMRVYEARNDFARLFCGSSKEFSLVKVEGLNLKNSEEDILMLKDLAERIVFLREESEEKVFFLDQELLIRTMTKIKLPQLTTKPINVFRFLILM